MTMMATCVEGHEHDLGDVPTDQGLVHWECPNCQSREIVAGTEPEIVVIPDSPEGITQVTDGDTGTGTTQ